MMNIIIPVIITSIMTIFIGFAIKKTIECWRRYKKRCIGCGSKSNNWSSYGVPNGYRRCDDCGKVQLRLGKRKRKKEVN